jgi:hypothetical protein
LDDAFSELEVRMCESFEFLSIQDMVLRLPEYLASTVFFGLRPDRSGYLSLLERVHGFTWPIYSNLQARVSSFRGRGNVWSKNWRSP